MTAQSNRTQGYVAHLRINHHRLLLGNSNVLNLTGNELIPPLYCLIFFYQESWSGIVDLDCRWKLFYSGTDPSMSAQAGVGFLTSPHLSDCLFDWIPLGL